MHGGIGPRPTEMCRSGYPDWGSTELYRRIGVIPVGASFLDLASACIPGGEGTGTLPQSDHAALKPGVSLSTEIGPTVLL